MAVIAPAERGSLFCGVIPSFRALTSLVMTHSIPSPVHRAGSGTLLLSLVITTWCGLGRWHEAAPLRLPAPLGCVPAPLPDDPPPADFTVSVVTRTAAHPWFGLPGAHPLAFSVNGTEGLVLNLVRGTTYTFAIATGAQHPMVFTSSMEGGFLNTAQVIAVSGTPASAGTISFTPTTSTPSLLYYNCNNHSYMGGVINVTIPWCRSRFPQRHCSKGPLIPVHRKCGIPCACTT